MENIDRIYNAVLEGDSSTAKAEVESALKSGLIADQIMQQGLIAAMREVGRRFEEGDYFVPEMLIAARAMQSALGLLKPYLSQSGAKATGRVAIGTVKGDLHDIGKNLVGMMLEGAGFEVKDLGVDVAPETFVQAAQEGAEIVGMSALLTTTMGKMEATIKALNEAGVREKVKVIIGGAPVTENYAKQIGADAFAPDASSAARLAQQLME
jgi:5-methyltetrahydrofolate--homocysteine methyltransferase